MMRIYHFKNETGRNNAHKVKKPRSSKGFFTKTSKVLSYSDIKKKGKK